MLINYSFYKNVLYIACQYIFSLWSCYSGQPLYEPLIYQCYNLFFTSLPIFFYCTFDLEYHRSIETDPQYQNFLASSGSKANKVHAAVNPHDDVQEPQNDGDKVRGPYLLEHPLLYKASMNGEYFNICIFVGYLAYALFHAALVYYMCFHSLMMPEINQPDGK